MSYRCFASDWCYAIQCVIMCLCLGGVMADPVRSLGYAVVNERGDFLVYRSADASGQVVWSPSPSMAKLFTTSRQATVACQKSESVKRIHDDGSVYHVLEVLAVR